MLAHILINHNWLPFFQFKDIVETKISVNQIRYIQWKVIRQYSQASLLIIKIGDLKYNKINVVA